MKTNSVVILLACLTGMCFFCPPLTAGVLTGSQAPAPGSVNLTSQGTLDWAHWGLTAPADFDQKSGGTNRISNFTQVTGVLSNAVNRFGNASVAYSWADGTPTDAASGTTSGIWVNGLTNGFAFTVSADTTTKELKVYAGAWNAQIRFEAALSDGSAPAFIDESFDDTGAGEGSVYTIKYAASSAGQTLIVKVYVIAMHDPIGGNCTLMAASLGTPAASTGALTVTGTFLPDGEVVNLTSQGSLDWAHWGLVNPEDFNHKTSGAQKISNVTPLGIGSPTQIAANTVAYTWTDGTPTLNSSNTAAVSVSGEGNGFKFTAPADTTTRMLKVYVTAYSARVRFEADLSDASAASVTDDSFNATVDQQAPVRVYQVKYKADSANQTLSVKCSVLNDEGSGFVSLQSATLALLPAQSGALAGGYTVLSVSATVNLTDEGRIDWAHWGLNNPTDLDRKIGGTNVISNFSVIGVNKTGEPLEVQQFGDNLIGYSWTNGTPTLMTPKSTSGIWVAQPGGSAGPGLNSGFQVSVPADTTVRALKIYVGNYGATVHFEASLSDGSAPTYVDESYFNASDGPNRVYTLTFSAASPGQKLIVRWWLKSLSDQTWGNCTLLSAAIRDASPLVSLVSPANDSIFVQPGGGLKFKASTIAPFSIASSGMGLALNQVNVSSLLVVTGTGTARSAAFNGLQANRFYNGLIWAVDNNGRGTTNVVNFDTFSTNGVVVIEAEDYNHDSGQFKDNPVPGDYTSLPGTPEVDFFTVSALANAYRPSDPIGIVVPGETRWYFTAVGTNNHQIVALNPDDWQNYTRTFPSGNYNVYLRYNAQLLQTVQLDLVTSSRGQPNQTLKPVGSFFTPPLVTDVPRNYAALTNSDGSLVSVPLSGVQTLRLTAGADVSGDGYLGLKEDFLMLVPVLTMQPRMTASFNAGQITISFSTQSGSVYTLQYKSALADPTWQDILPSIAGDGSVKSVRQPTVQPTRFYRLSVQ